MTPAMFTEGLDRNALRWAREVPVPTSLGQQQRVTTFHNRRRGGRGFVLPRPGKFRSGHLPVSRTTPLEDDTASGSDMDESSDTEEEIYGGRYSLESSSRKDLRQQHRIPQGFPAVGRYTTPATIQQKHYLSDTYSEVSSTQDTTWQRHPQQQRIHANASDFSEEEDESDSEESSKFNSRLCGRSEEVNDPTRTSESASGVRPGNEAAVTQSRSSEFTLRVGAGKRGVCVQPWNSKFTYRVSGINEGVNDQTRNSEFTSGVGGGNKGAETQFTSWVGTCNRDVDAHLQNSELSNGVSGNKGVNCAQIGSTRPVESCYSSVPFRSDVETDTEKAHPANNYPKSRLQDQDIPSAPPFSSSRIKVKNEEENPSCNSFSKDLNCSDAKQTSSYPTTGNKPVDQHVRTNSVGVEAATTSGSYHERVPTFHASGQGHWYSVIAYDACVRLCLHSWARGCMEAPMFLENECALLRTSFGLQQVLLQSEEELLEKRTSRIVNEGSASKPKKTCGKMKVQVRKVRMALDMPSGCNFSSLTPSTVTLQSFQHRMSNLQSTLSAGWQSLRSVRISPHLPPNSSFSRHSLAYMHASTQYIKEVSGLFKIGMTTLRSKSAIESMQETYYCMLKLKSSSEDAGIRMHPGSSETHVFFPDSVGDDLIVEVYDSKGKLFGRVVAQVSSIVEDTNDKLRWWSIFREPEHELVGRVQLYISYTTSLDDNHSKCGSVAETVAYDLVLEVAMKVQHFRQRNLLLHGSWKWLLIEFASYYGVSDVYTKLRYLSYVMDVATPTADCLTLVHDLLSPVVMRSKSTLSHQENRILGEIEEQIEQILSTLFENYKSLDESSPSGLMEVFKPATGSPAPALLPAVKLYTLLHDILTPEAQLKLCGYFQAAAKKRSRRHLGETDEFIGSNSEVALMDVISMTTAYRKMKELCINVRNEIYTDIEIHGSHVLPSFVDLPNIAASIYSVELFNRLRAFLVACPPSGPSPPVAELVIATSDLQRDLSSWNISPVKGGVDAKELFHLYIILWIQDKRLSLLELCKLDKVKWSGVRTSHCTTPFVDEMYDRLKDTLNEYEVIICRWPEYTFALENAIADIEKAVLEALDKQYADVLAPLKENINPKKFGLKYVQKLAKRNSTCPYTVPDELGILLNTMKRLLDILRPKIEVQLKSWGSCLPDGGNAVAGERLSEVTVLLRAKFRNYLQAVVEKLAENTRGQSATKLKKIIQDSKDTAMESDIRNRMQSLKEQLTKTITHLHTVYQPHVFIAICRGYWDRMGQDVLKFLESRKENRSWYKASRVTVAVLDDTFASQMQQLLGNSLQEKDLEPPRSILEVRSILCKDVPNHKDSNFYY